MRSSPLVFCPFPTTVAAAKSIEANNAVHHLRVVVHEEEEKKGNRAAEEEAEESLDERKHRRTLLEEGRRQFSSSSSRCVVREDCSYAIIQWGSAATSPTTAAGRAGSDAGYVGDKRERIWLEGEMPLRLFQNGKWND